jgi:predicted AlkP superfamily phosphohydrolase/phosphomutase
MRQTSPRVAVIGLDCAAPQLVFEAWRDELPVLARLAEEGAWGRLRSCHPPITVPAWACMMSGYDPGQLGYYGFRNRKDYDYCSYAIADARAVKADRVWDILSRAGYQVVLAGVPQTYPIRPVNGVVVSDFLTPSTQSEYVYPRHLKPEVERIANGYVLDVEDFRTQDKAALLERIYTKTRKHFAVARHLAITKAWDFFMMVEMGVDRIHHGFWSHMDRAHPKHVPGNPFQNAIRDYYRFVDVEVGSVLEALPPDTVIFVVSDHGARRMEGGLCVNEWLAARGDLVFRNPPNEPTPIDKADIEWSRTRVWGDGGYYARLFLNVRGREPVGVIDPTDYEGVRDELIAAVENITDPAGRNLGSRAYRPEKLYRSVRGVAPDLIAYFGNLAWRSVGTVGLGSIHTFDNDTGPDEANHDWDGIFVLNDVGCRQVGLDRGERQSLQIYDVGPTILDLFGMWEPHDGPGQPLRRV